jgi:hypothetical protein
MGVNRRAEMQPGHVKNSTRMIGNQHKQLAIRDEMVTVAMPNGMKVPLILMVSAWFPNPRELEALNAGAPVHVKIIGNVHPPIGVEVGEVPSNGDPGNSKAVSEKS